jgi:hypothetical protein
MKAIAGLALSFFSTFVLSGAYALSTNSSTPAYCAAIRGNGENVAAHWSAMARLVEELGMPQAMAGGSSATVTMFFTESIAQNGFVNSQSDLTVKHHMQGLMLKSLPVYIAIMAKTEGALDAFQFMKKLGAEDSKLKQALTVLLEGGANSQEILAKLKEYGPLFNPNMLNGLTVAPEFYRKEILSAVSVFGKFDAVGDTNLFFRPGVVDFKFFALLLGQIADTYAGLVNGNPDANNLLNDFLSTCSKSAYGKQWEDIDAGCQQKFAAFVVTNLKTGNHGHLSTRLFDRVGKTLLTLPTTSVVSGDSKKMFLDKSALYAQGKDFKPEEFTVNFDKDLNYGYWGNLKTTERIRKNVKALFPHDLKSDKFMSLGPANWFEVLSTSPAEPGLANIQMMPTSTTRDLVGSESRQDFTKRWQGLTYRDDFVSSGGWSDLHPTLVLRAAGCENVVYVNRKDGDTVFGQQVFIRLTGTTKELPFWERIADHNKEGWDVSDDQAKLPWNRISNMGNRESSIRIAIDEADAVYCTDWNVYDVFKGEMLPMVREAYTSPVFVKDSSKSWLGVNPNSTPRSTFVPGCQN